MSLRRRVSRALRAENWKAAYVLLPAFLGVFTFGGMVGIWIGVNVYITAMVALGLWINGAVLMLALEDRRRAGGSA